MSKFLEKYGKKTNVQRAERVDFSTLKTERIRDFYKCAKGVKNSFVILCESGNDDPFVQWGYHKSLQEVDYYSIPCDNHNKGESCPVCDRVTELKKDDFEGNKPIFNPIDVKIDNYARVVPIDENGTFEEKAYWFRVPVSVMFSLIKQMENLEADEHPFYDRKNQSKLVVEYDPNESPAKQYSVVLKEIKASKAMPEEKIDTLIGNMKPLTYYTPSRKTEDVSNMCDSYLLRKVEELEQLANAQ